MRRNQKDHISQSTNKVPSNLPQEYCHRCGKPANVLTYTHFKAPRPVWLCDDHDPTSREEK
jgi:hypothetical protein